MWFGLGDSAQTYPSATVRPASAIHAQRTQPHTHYERRRPETTVLDLLVREHIDTFHTQVKTESGLALPHHVEKEFDDGVLPHGFLRLHCGACREDHLVGFSCKGRGFCPSCGGRRMAQTAAHLVDQSVARCAGALMGVVAADSTALPARRAPHIAEPGVALPPPSMDS